MVGDNLKAEGVKLINERTTVETQIEIITSRLSHPGGPGLTGNLLDSDGFPRADIDIPSIRADRNRLAMLYNDHKVLTNKIEKILHILHSNVPSASSSFNPSQSTTLMTDSFHPTSTSNTIISLPTTGREESMAFGTTKDNDMEINDQYSYTSYLPFAIIDEVASTSPAEMDGLLVGDRILKFGEVTSGPDALLRISQLLSVSHGQTIGVTLLRQGSVTNLHITPRVWQGRGLVGCHIRPL